LLGAFGAWFLLGAVFLGAVAPGSLGAVFLGAVAPRFLGACGG